VHATSGSLGLSEFTPYEFTPYRVNSYEELESLLESLASSTPIGENSQACRLKIASSQFLSFIYRISVFFNCEMFLMRVWTFQVRFFEARGPNNRTVASKKRETNGGHLVLGFRRTKMLFVTSQLHKLFIYM
jgi:hypothetical protein